MEHGLRPPLIIQALQPVPDLGFEFHLAPGIPAMLSQHRARRDHRAVGRMRQHARTHAGGGHEQLPGDNQQGQRSLPIPPSRGRDLPT